MKRTPVLLVISLLAVELCLAGVATAAPKGRKPPARREKKPAAAKHEPTRHAAPKHESPQPHIVVTPDGAIEHDGIVTRYWEVNHQNPAELANEMKRYFHSNVKFEAKAKSQNILRIDAPPEKWPIIKQVLDVLDVPEPQVFVDAKIIEIRHDSNLEFGFNASYDRRQATNGPQTFFGSFSAIFDPESYLQSLGTSNTFQGGTFNFQTVNGVKKHGQWTYILRALQERGSAEILSQPSIIAIQGQKASINTGTQFPVQDVRLQGTTTIVSTSFKQTGVQLDITPKLVGREYVTLDLDAKDSEITDRIAGPSGALNPVINNREAKTEVSVRDGETIIIGGLLTTSTIESKSGLPILSDIPIISYFASSTRTQKVKSELVFFITPRIVKRKQQTVILPPGERKRLKENE